MSLHLAPARCFITVKTFLGSLLVFAVENKRQTKGMGKQKPR